MYPPVQVQHSPSLAVRFSSPVFDGTSIVATSVAAPTVGAPLAVVRLPAIGRVPVAAFTIGNTWGAFVHVRADGGSMEIGVALNGGSTVGEKHDVGPSWQGPILALLGDSLVLTGSATSVDLLVTPATASQWTSIVEGRVALSGALGATPPVAKYTRGQVACPDGVETVVTTATVPPGRWLAVCSANAADLAPDPGCTWGFRLTDNSGIPYFTLALQPVAPVPRPGFPANALALLELMSSTQIQLRATVVGGVGQIAGGFFVLPAAPL